MTAPAQGLTDRWAQPSALWIAAFCLAQVVVWTLTPTLLAFAPPHDVIEGYVWGREWVIGTYKHPALPSWVLEASRIAIGQLGWPAYLISQLFVAATYLCVFAVGRDLMGSSRSAAATLLLAPVYFFSWPTPEFNHSIAQMPFWVAFVWTFWRATTRRTMVWWLLAAVLAAAGMYAKLSTAIIIAVAAAWLAYDRNARTLLATAGPWIALLALLALMVPLAFWLWRYSFLPLLYVEKRSHHHAVGAVGFLGFQLVYHAAMLAVLAWAVLFRPTSGDPQGDVSQKPIDASAKRFLIFVAIAPLTVAVTISAASGLRLRPDWGSSFSALSGLLGIALTWHWFSSVTLKRIAIAAAVSLVIVPGAYTGDALYGVRKSHKGRMAFRMQRINYPQKAIAEHVIAAWEQATDRPLRIVVGGMRVAGLVVLAAPSSPSLLQYDYWRSPWITPQRLRAEGALVVWSEPRKRSEERMHELFVKGKGLEEHKVKIGWPRSRHNESITIGNAIILPERQ